jgi:transcriptional regulator with XRE-family HTH domain
MNKRLQAVIERAQHRQSLPPPEARRLLRLMAGVTQQELADTLGISAASLCRYECGHRNPIGRIRLRYIQVCEELARVSRTA